MTDATKIIAYKGFDRDFRCRGFQYAIGSTYDHDGDVIACSSGFHASEHPLDVFGYYPPATSRFAIVVMSGQTDSEEGGGTKIAAAKITVEIELSLHDMIESAVKHVFDGAKWLKKSAVTKDERAASAKGDMGAASAKGNRGAALAKGDMGAASATGSMGAALATGYMGAASATGNMGAAMSSGRFGRVRGADGCALFALERDSEWAIISTASGIVGNGKIKADTWYICQSGNLVEVEA